MDFDPSVLDAIFADCFLDSHRTRLSGGADEPIYLPSAEPECEPHRILYREDYFASALHEVAHWCLAGPARRRMEDYGYWYEPDGRSAAQQAEFERVEARPQALEWIFSDACGFGFQLSADNLEGGAGPSEGFARAVAEARRGWLERGLPIRAACFREALAQAWGSAGAPAPMELGPGTEARGSHAAIRLRSRLRNRLRSPTPSGSRPPRPAAPPVRS